MSIMGDIEDFRAAGREDAGVETDIFVRASEAQSYKRNRPLKCTRCSKGVHNTRVNLKRCRGKDCECMCQVYYEGLDGRLREHGMPDDSFRTPEPEAPPNPELDRLVEAANALARSRR